MTFVFTFMFMILVFWRPQEWLVPWLYGLPLLDVVVLSALASLVIELDSGALRWPKRMPQPYLIMGLWFAVIMSHVSHTYFAGLMRVLFPTFKICFFVFLLYVALDDVKKLRLVTKMTVFMCVFMAIHAVLQQHRGYGFGGHPPLWMGYYTRSMFFGIFEDPNDLAQMLAAGIPLGFCLTRRNQLVNTLIGVPIAYLLILGVLSTNSRGGLVALAAAIGMMVAMWLPAKWTPFLVGVMGAAALFLCPLSASFMDDSAHDRVAFWGSANWAFKSSPIFGVGKSMLIEYIPGDKAVHNMYVLCYAELGVFGYWFWFGMLLLGYLGCWRARVALRRPTTVNERWMKNYTGMMMASMAAFAASGYFLTRAYVYPLFFLFVMLGVVSRITQGMLPPDHAELISVRRDLFVYNTFLSLASIAYIYVSIILLNAAW